MQLIDISKIHPDKRNANVMSSQDFEKLCRSIDEDGICQAPLVRPHPKKPGHYIYVDGHHRGMAAKRAGMTQLLCQVKEMSRKEATKLLLILNRLRGNDVPAKRAELIESLLDIFQVDELAQMLPETTDEIKGLLALLQQDDNALEKAFREQIEFEEKTLPVPFGFMVLAKDAEAVYQAFKHYQNRQGGDQGKALVSICRDVMNLKENGGNHDR